MTARRRAGGDTAGDATRGGEVAALVAWSLCAAHGPPLPRVNACVERLEVEAPFVAPAVAAQRRSPAGADAARTRRDSRACSGYPAGMSEQERRGEDDPSPPEDWSEEAGPYGEGGTPGESEQSGGWADEAGPYGEGEKPADED